MDGVDVVSSAKTISKRTNGLHGRYAPSSAHPLGRLMWWNALVARVWCMWWWHSDGYIPMSSADSCSSPFKRLTSSLVSAFLRLNALRVLAYARSSLVVPHNQNNSSSEFNPAGTQHVRCCWCRGLWEYQWGWRAVASPNGWFNAVVLPVCVPIPRLNGAFHIARYPPELPRANTASNRNSQWK